MVRETQLFFEELLKDDLSLRTSSTRTSRCSTAGSRSTTASRTCTGVEFRKVALPPEYHRGGVLTHGERAEGHRQRHDDLAGAARRVGARPHPGPARAAAARRRASRRAGHPRRHDDPRATRQAPADGELARAATRRSTRRASRWRTSTSSAAGASTTDRHRAEELGEEPRRSTGQIPAAYRYGEGLHVEAGDALPDGRKFADIDGFKKLLLADGADRPLRDREAPHLRDGPSGRLRRPRGGRARSSQRQRNRTTGCARWSTRSSRANSSEANVTVRHQNMATMTSPLHSSHAAPSCAAPASRSRCRCWRHAPPARTGRRASRRGG